MVAVVYLAYCVKQGMKELNNDNVELPYPRILAILIEAFNVLTFIFVLTQLEVSQIVSLIPDLIIVIGMAYLLTQNLKNSLWQRLIMSVNDLTYKVALK